MKNQILHIALTSIVFISLKKEAIADENKHVVSLEEIANFRESKDDYLLASLLVSLQKDNKPPADIAKLLFGILIEADTYLTIHQCPKDTPSINIAPPGGGRSGVDPRSIADPTKRVAYQKLIDENRILVEAHRKHSSVTKIRDSALNIIATYHTNGLISDNQIDLIMDQLIKTEVQKVTLRQLVKTAAANKD
jgi:hypothetical protein